MSPARRRHRRAVTLIEQLLFTFLLFLGVLGAEAGSKIGSHGRFGATVGGVLGFIVGIASVPFAVFLAEVVRRLCQPSQYRCRCARADDPGPRFLRPITPVAQRAIAETARLSDWSELAALKAPERLTPELLEDRLARGDLTREQIEIAARLGHPAALAVRAQPFAATPVRRGRQTQDDIEHALHSGLPPRLCLLWATACVARALPACEREFHQDTRPRQALGAAVLILRDDDPQAKARRKPRAARIWRSRNAGCRVVRRSVWDRLTERATAGENAGEAAFALLRSVYDYLEPDLLWAPPGQYETGGADPRAKSRCERIGPWHRAGEVAGLTRAAADDPLSELQWQRDALAALVLGDTRWCHDREEWRGRVDDRWLPRVRERAHVIGVNLDEYAARVRKELIPWRSEDRDP